MWIFLLLHFRYFFIEHGKFEIGKIKRVWHDDLNMTSKFISHHIEVRTFWETHKIWKNLPHALDVYHR